MAAGVTCDSSGSSRRESTGKGSTHGGMHTAHRRLPSCIDSLPPTSQPTITAHPHVVLPYHPPSQHKTRLTSSLLSSSNEPLSASTATCSNSSRLKPAQQLTVSCRKRCRPVSCSKPRSVKPGECDQQSRVSWGRRATTSAAVSENAAPPMLRLLQLWGSRSSGQTSASAASTVLAIPNHTDSTAPTVRSSR